MCCMVFLLVFGVLGNRDASAAVDSYTKLLIHGDSIADVATGKTVTVYGDAAVSNAGKTVTANGNAQIDTAQGKFGGVSGLFDGAGSYLTVPDSDDWSFGSENFTIDFWVRWNSLPASGNIQEFLGHRTDFNNDVDFRIWNDSGTYRLGIIGKSGGIDYINLQGAASLSINTWYHIAFVRSGSNTTIYLDGTSIATVSSSYTYADYTGLLYIADHPDHLFNVNKEFNGWLDELRISKGIARWTSDFTPTTEAYTSDNCTKLLLHFDGSDGSTSFTDSSRDHFKGKAISFDGSGDYLSIPDSDDWNLGSGAFTIDGWVRFNTIPSTIAQMVFEQRQDNSNVMWLARGGGVWNFYLTIGFVTQIDFTSTSTVVANTWYHIAIVRSSNTWYMFQDGVQIGITTNSSTIPNLTGPVEIGRRGDATRYLDGWIDELRISKGIGRWTSDFCTPTAPYGIEDTTPPTVSSTSPASNATGVAVDSTISATFSEDMNSSTINTSTFTLSDSDGNNVSGTVSFGCCDKTATFTPSSNLAYSTTYTATITTGTKDMGENPLTSDYLWTFTTVSDPNISPECYQFVTKWGSYGTGDGQFDGPWGVTVDSSGNIYIVDHKNHRVQKFSSDGTFITQWGSFGSGDGQFKAPWGVAADTSGNIYVADADNHRIQKFDSNGTFITKWGVNGSGDGQFNSPTGVTVDASGNIYVTDYLNNRVQKFDSSGTFITKWGSSGTGDGQFNFPFGVAVDASGNVYVVDDYNNRIQKFTSIGTFITKWGSFGTGDGKFDLPHGVAVDASGNVYVTDRHNNRVQKFSSDGTFITMWGSYGSEDGQFNYPGGVVVDASGNVYVTDYHNNRIQKFSPSPCEVTTPTTSPIPTAISSPTPLPSPTPAPTATPIIIITPTPTVSPTPTATQSPTPLPSPTPILTVTPKVTARGFHTVALKPDSTVWAWGHNGYGQLGDDSITDRTTPVQVSCLSNATAIESGVFHTIVLKSDGTVWTWGYNGYGQLGDGTTTDSTTPIQVSGLSNIIAIAGGGYHTIALKSDGTVWTWGRNEYGQLGDSTTLNRTSPVQVTDLSNIIAIEDGGHHTIALKSDGTVWTWGYNEWGQLGDGTTTNRTTPVQVSGLSGVTVIAGGNDHTIAMKSDGTVWAWGHNSYGQLGDGTATNTPRTTPVQVIGLSDIADIAGGEWHTIALKSDGTVWTWGDNTYGELGDGSSLDVRAIPMQISGLSDVVAIEGGFYHTVALKSDGTIWTWGYNEYGELGDGTNTNTSTPVQVNDFNVYQSSTTVTTNSANNVTSSSATLNGAINSNGLSTTVWFNYGTASDTYTDTSATQIISGPCTDNISIDISGLSPNTTYYYRIVAQNSEGTYYGGEMSFTTLSSVLPTPTAISSPTPLPSPTPTPTATPIIIITPTPIASPIYTPTPTPMISPTPTPTPDTTLPTVSSTSPAGGATGVTIDSVITVTFSEPMDASTIETSTFIVRDGNNNIIDGTVSYNDSTATFTPLNNLEYSTTYTVTITGVKDLAGNAMDPDFTFSFTTGEDPQPVANAGDDQTVNEDELVSLQGSGTAPQGVTLTYQWIQVAGPNVTLSDTNSPTPTFTASQVNANVTLTFQLVVGYENYTSDPDTIDVTIVNVNHAPIAYTGDDQTVDAGTLVTLHGETSYDPDASEITYQWTQVSGPPVTLSDSNSANPTFTAPSVAVATLLKFKLVVNDDELSSMPAYARVTVEHVNHAPRADTTGSTQTVNEGTQVSLDGSQSYDPDGDSITYQWTQVSGPTVTLSDLNSANPNFTAPQVTETTYLEFKLVVNDGQRSSEPAYATVTVLDTNQPIDCSSAAPSTATLWPPNHKLVSVSIEGVTDPDNEQVTITITGVTQDEPIDGLGDGDTSPDAVIQGDTVLLRAERSGTGDGRVYEVHFTADDGQGSTCKGSVRVSVPHDKKKTENATDSGQNYDSTQQ